MARGVWAVAAMLVVSAGCDGQAGAQDSTTSVPVTSAAETTSAETTATVATTTPTTVAATTTSTAAPSTSPATTIAQTTVGSTAGGSDEAEVLATLEAFYDATDRCLEAPDECDLDAILAEYSMPDTSIADWRRAEFDYFKSNGWVVEESEAIERTVKEFKLFDTPGRAYTKVCERDAAITVSYADGVRTVEAEGVGFYLREFYWEKTEGRWIIIESIMTSTEEPSEVPTCGYDG